LNDGREMIQSRDGSGNAVQQFIHGLKHIDEPVMICSENGMSFVYQGVRGARLRQPSSESTVLTAGTCRPRGSRRGPTWTVWREDVLR
jgi:hypothetical protein